MTKIFRRRISEHPIGSNCLHLHNLPEINSDDTKKRTASYDAGAKCPASITGTIAENLATLATNRERDRSHIRKGIRNATVVSTS